MLPEFVCRARKLASAACLGNEATEVFAESAAEALGCRLILHSHCFRELFRSVSRCFPVFRIELACSGWNGWKKVSRTNAFIHRCVWVSGVLASAKLGGIRDVHENRLSVSSFVSGGLWRYG